MIFARSMSNGAGCTIIAAWIPANALGAALAAAEVADDVGLTVHVVGTPAEEVGIASGKILLLERGAFGEKIDIAWMDRRTVRHGSLQHPSVISTVERSIREDWRMLDRTFSSEDNKDSTLLRRDGSLEQARSRKWGRCSGASSSTCPSTSHTSSQRSGVISAQPYSFRGAAKGER
jgi:hypothetical protein